MKRIIFFIIVLTFSVSSLYAQTPEKPDEKPQVTENQEKKAEKKVDKPLQLDKDTLEKIDKYVQTANSLREVQSDYNGALGFYKKALELDPKRSSTHWYIAGVYWKLENHAKVLEQLETWRSLMERGAGELNEVD